MIITFSGTSGGNNSAKKAAVLTAGLLSLSFNKKVCVIQVSHDTDDLISYLVGKEKSSVVTELQNYGVDTKGLDSLLRKASSASVTEEYFKTACENMLKTENAFDILGASKIKNFSTSLTSASRSEALQRLVKSANQFYDYVVLYLPHLNAEQIKVMAENENNVHAIADLIALSDVNVCCVRQGDREEPALNQNNNIFLVTHFDPESAYTLKYVKNEYKKDDPKAKIFAMNHNTSFKDACSGKDLRRWLTKNYNISMEDINYDFVNNMLVFTSYISDSNPIAEPEPTVNKRHKKEKVAKEKIVKQPSSQPEE